MYSWIKPLLNFSGKNICAAENAYAKSYYGVT